ncbi:hypothetical protein ACFL3X_01105 [Gemmatimonadota bacterium]
MSNDILLLAASAASIGFLHTLLGPDHYLPFIVMSRAREWSLSKTAWITVLCGIGHVLSSVVLGLVGVAVGVAVFRLEALESVRGDLAGWALIAFGFAYAVWGIRAAVRHRPHRHAHLHAEESAPNAESEQADGHEHEHIHVGLHSHTHDYSGKKLTPWVLFIIFVLGPCEPLIPLLMYPAARESTAGLILVTVVFGVVTITTMVAVVLLASWGVGFTRLGRLERYTHALAGAAILLSGLAIKFLGL